MKGSQVSLFLSVMMLNRNPDLPAFFRIILILIAFGSLIACICQLVAWLDKKEAEKSQAVLGTRLPTHAEFQSSSGREEREKHAAILARHHPLPSSRSTISSSPGRKENRPRSTMRSPEPSANPASTI